MALRSDRYRFTLDEKVKEAAIQYLTSKSKCEGDKWYSNKNVYEQTGYVKDTRYFPPKLRSTISNLKAQIDAFVTKFESNLPSEPVPTQRLSGALQPGKDAQPQTRPRSVARSSITSAPLPPPLVLDPESPEPSTPPQAPQVRTRTSGKATQGRVSTGSTVSAPAPSQQPSSLRRSLDELTRKGSATPSPLVQEDIPVAQEPLPETQDQDIPPPPPLPSAQFTPPSPPPLPASGARSPLLGQIESGARLKSAQERPSRPKSMVRQSPDQSNLLFDALAQRRKNMRLDRESVSESDLPQPGKDASVRSPAAITPQQPTPAVAASQPPAIVPQPEPNQALLEAIRGGKALKKSGERPAAGKEEPAGVLDKLRGAIDHNRLPKHLQDSDDVEPDNGEWDD